MRLNILLSKKLQPLDEAAMVAVRLPVACWILPNCNICNSSCGELNQSGRGLEIVWVKRSLKIRRLSEDYQKIISQ